MATRIAFLQLMNVNPSTGAIFQRGGNTQDIDGNDQQQDLPVKGALSFSTEFRVIEDGDLPNTSGNPDIKTYIGLESDEGFDVQQINQTMIITTS